jgi:hypothetical protein
MRLAIHCAVFALQSFHVLFLLLHDWVPLGRLNDLKSVRAVHSRPQLIAGTLNSPGEHPVVQCPDPPI